MLDGRIGLDLWGRDSGVHRKGRKGYGVIEGVIKRDS
jgi:hypothetical protein